MMKQVLLYAALLAAFSVQQLLSAFTPWTPDLVIALVVFTGVFRGAREAFFFGLAAGALRGVFSVNTLGADILIFPSAGILSSALTGVFYRFNPANQMLIVLMMCLGVIAAHTVYLDAVSANSTGIVCAISGSWRVVLSTVAVSPLLFTYLRPLAGEDD